MDNQIKMSGVFILPLISQPRFVKRINEIKKSGVGIKIFSFERDYFKGNTDQIDFYSMGKIKHGNYLKRISGYIKAFQVLKENKIYFEEADFIYVFGVDLLAFIRIAMKILGIRCELYCEVADIRGVFLQNNFKSKIARFFERMALKNVRKIIITSPYFFESYYNEVQNMEEDQFLVIENKLTEKVGNYSKKRISNDEDRIVIGFFGLLRCNRSWEIMKKIASELPEKFEIYVRGYNMNLVDFESDLKKYKNIRFEGEFKSPEDLANIYSKVDISWVGNIGENDLNAKIALPNRLYEGLAFNTPIVAHYNSGVGRRVSELEIGWNLDFLNPIDTLNTLKNITRKDILHKRSNTFVSEELIYGQNDHIPLISNINAIKGEG